MSIETINVGSSPNDGTGDSLRTAFITTNNNFSYLGGGLTNVSNNFSTNSNSTYTLDFAFNANSALSISANAMNINSTVTISYANVTAGSTKMLVFKNASGSSRNVVLPNTNNNNGTTTNAVADGRTAFFQFICFDSTSANVAVMIVES
jgi:hypothetical protein